MAFKKQRFDNQINAGSMADIAFLLLTFFLMTTTISMDKGILVKLPPIKEDSTRAPERNVLNVKITAANELMVEREPASIKSLKERTKTFIMNPDNLPTLPPSPKNAVVSLQNDRGTAYKAYIEVYNEIKAAYNELWDEAAQSKFQSKYELLEDHLKKSIRDEIPLVISEAEPTDHQ